MDHVAIMRKSWGLLPKILNGEKTVESRFYKNKSAPWGKIKSGETIYFKDSGEPVTVQAEVERVVELENLDLEKIHNIRTKYQKELGLSLKDLTNFDDFFKEKRYGILIFLINVRKIKPINIDKKGFGSAAAWLCIRDISSYRI